MKKLILAMFLVTLAFQNIYSQGSPQGVNYQATVRGSEGQLITNQNVNFKFNIMLDSQTSSPIYSEGHYVPTDDIGQVNLIIGQGSSLLGDFQLIEWGLGDYFIGIELDIDGSGYIAMGTSQLWSVPYALYAESSGTSQSGSQNLESVLTEGNSANDIKITNLLDPEDEQDATTKSYVDQLMSDLQDQIDDQSGSQNLESVLTEGNSANDIKITNLLDPEDEQDATTKSYVDQLMSDLQDQIDDQPPVISIFGEALISINQFSNFSDPGAVATDIQEGDISSSIIVTGEVNTEEVGVYGIAYNVADSEGNNAFAVTRTVTILDATSSSITLIGDENLTVEGGSTYQDPGISAIDNVDGDISNNVVITCTVAPENTNSIVTGLIDTFVLGEYILVYTISDSAGNSSSISRTITVVDTTPPEIIGFNQEGFILHPQGDPYSAPNIQVIDIIDGDITANAVFSYTLNGLGLEGPTDVPEVDVNFRRTYNESITVSDSSGNTVMGTNGGGATGAVPQRDIIVYCTPEPGSYALAMYDSYGDGWVGNQGDNSDFLSVYLLFEDGTSQTQQFSMCDQWSDDDASYCTTVAQFGSFATFEVPEGTVSMEVSLNNDYYGEIGFQVYWAPYAAQVPDQPTYQGTLLYQYNTGSNLFINLNEGYQESGLYFGYSIPTLDCYFE